MQLYQPNQQSSVFFSSSFGKELKLIEVPEDVLKLVDSGESLSIVGNEDDAVLCTKDRTYSIKRVEYSNSVYFLPPSSTTTFTIESSCSDYYEVKIIPGRLEQIDTMLSDTVYRGAAYEQENPVEDSKLVKRSDLAEVIQASSTEVDKYLKILGVIEINGYLRMLSKSTVQDTTQQLFLTFLAESWKIDTIDENACSSLLTDSDPIILNHVLQLLGSKVDGLWNLSIKEVLKASAHLIFKSMASEDKKMLATQFSHEWFQQTPGVSNESALDESLLKGIAIREESESVRKVSAGSYYRYFPFHELSRDAKTRFKQLYEVKAKFASEELEPYMQDLFGGVGQPKSMAEVLLQHTNCINGLYLLK